MADLRVAFYARVSNKEQATDKDALTRQLWQLRRKAKAVSENWLEFIDIQSGRKDDRPEFQKLLKMLYSREINFLVVTRIDRIARDAEMNARLAKLFEKQKIEIHEILLGSEIDFKNPQMWSYFVNAGVKAEGESRMLSARILQTMEWKREQSKPLGGQLGLGYRRSTDGFVEPDPDRWQTAIDAIKIILEEGGTTVKALIRIREELGIVRSRQWLHHWARSPLLRGHTPYDTRDDRGFRKKRSVPRTIVENTHQSLFDDPQLKLLDAERMLENCFLSHARKKGKAKQYLDYPLSGLLICGRCGANSHIRRIRHSKYPDKEYFYVVCSERADKVTSCGGEYGSLRGQRNSNGGRQTINSHYKDAERAVIQALQQRAVELITIAATSKEETFAVVENQEVKDLRATIARYEAMNDPDLAEVISRKITQLNDLLLKLGRSSKILDRELEAMLPMIATPSYWWDASSTEKTNIFKLFVESVACDVDKYTVKLKV